MRKLWKYSGIFLSVIGLIHTVVVFTIPALVQVWSEIFSEGLFNTIGTHMDRNCAFFSLMVGILLIYTGICWNQQIKQSGKPLTKSAAWGLLGIALGGLVFVPVSGFWLLILLGIIMLMPHYGRTPRA